MVVGDDKVVNGVMLVGKGSWFIIVAFVRFFLKKNSNIDNVIIEIFMLEINQKKCFELIIKRFLTLVKNPKNVTSIIC